MMRSALPSTSPTTVSSWHNAKRRWDTTKSYRHALRPQPGMLRRWPSRLPGNTGPVTVPPERAAVPGALLNLAERSASPESSSSTLHRIADEHPEATARLMTGSEPSPLASVLVAVSAASNSLGRLCVADHAALDVLDDLDRPCPDRRLRTRPRWPARSAWRCCASRRAIFSASTRSRRSERHWPTSPNRSSTPRSLLSDPARPIAVIGMGKLGGRELNYASDVDVLFVTDDEPDEDAARRILQVAHGCFRIDVDLRPEGRAGPLTRSLDSYGAYWARWAATWEFQALLKARAVAGEAELGAAFEQRRRAAGVGTELQRRRAGRGALDEGPGRGGRRPPGPPRAGDQARPGRDP